MKEQKFMSKMTCTACKGTGLKINDPKKYCLACEGSGVLSQWVPYRSFNKR